MCNEQLFLDDDGPWRTFVCGLPHSRLQVLRDLIYEDTRNHLIFVVLKHLGTNLVTVSVPHAQVIIDLDLHALLNASEACGENGSICLATSRDAEGRAVLSIADDGVGIAPADLGSVFDPFFTTKLATQGNGLGLSICYAIVRRVGGDIRVSSTPGKGTKVEVALRVHERSHH